MYITDSGVNAIIKREGKTKQLSVFARLPGLNATTDAVPTGIVYDGSNLLVSGLSGFPFTVGATKIYLVTPPAVGFTPKTGRIADGTTASLMSPLDRPTDIERAGDKTNYVLDSGDGTLLKLTRLVCNYRFVISTYALPVTGWPWWVPVTLHMPSQ